MYFYDTQNKSFKISAQTLISRGRLNRTKGFYLPETIPHLSERLIYKNPAPSFREVAGTVVHTFFNDIISENDLSAFIVDAFPFKAPVFPIDPHTYILDLSQGGSGGCSDFGARLTAQLIHHIQTQVSKPVHVLLSGTGTYAVSLLRAFSDEKNIPCTLLYPKTDCSITKELNTKSYNTIHAFAVDGTLDDCRNLIDTAASDATLNEKMIISLPDAADFSYMLAYTICSIYAALTVLGRSCYDTEIENPLLIMGSTAEQTGYLSGAMFAKSMNAPLNGFISTYAYNTAKTAIANQIRSKPAIPSRIELLQDYERIQILQEKNTDVQTALYQFNADDIAFAIRDCHDRTGITLSPKSAGTWKAWQSIRKGTYTEQSGITPPNITGKNAPEWITNETYRKNTICTIIETAHPALYPVEVKKAIGTELPVPYHLRQKAVTKQTPENILADYTELKDWLYSFTR